MLRPLVWAKGKLLLLDQTLLPHHERYLTCRTPAQVARAIKELRVRGAPLIGITAAYGMALADGKGIARAAKVLAEARPTAVNLRAMVDRVLRVTEAGGDALTEARRIHAEDAAMCEAIGRNGARLVPRGARVMTICNSGALATGGIGTAYAVLKRSRDITVYACETRPVWQGARLTMYELAKDRIPAFLIPDGAAAATMRDKEIDLVVTGADRIARNGDAANKIGTYALAIAARAHRIPFYVAAPRSTFDLSLKTGREIPIEEHSAEEVLTAAPRDARAYNPAFDVTPARLITAFITDAGVFPPSKVETVLGARR
jgi:methylthioribose-1-phosphate isomerase